MYFKNIWLCIFLATLIAVSSSLLAATPSTSASTYEYKLDNGLKLIVREDHRSPIVVTQVWYKVGGSFEPNGITGISHVLEHMMFRGTTNHPKDAFSRLIAIGGGDQNAFTADDFTAYFQELEADRLKLCFELEADRMANLTIPEEAFKQEIKVVMEERRLRVDDNPEALTDERLRAAAHVSNPYHHEPIGWMNDLENLKVEDVRAWYKNWYGPNNAIVVVVGDVNPEAVFELAKTYFGPLKPIAVPELKPRKELVNLGKRHITVNTHATVPRLFMSYNAPSVPSMINTMSTGEGSVTHPKEPYALLVLLMALDGGNSGRFSKELIRNQGLITSVFSSYNPFSLHETLVNFTAIPTQNHTLAEVESAFLNQIEQLKTMPISDAELNRIKVNVIAQHIYGKDSMSDQAIELGMLESVGLSWKLADTFPEYIQNITAEDIQKVAQKYLTQERLTVAELIPLKSGN